MTMWISIHQIKASIYVSSEYNHGGVWGPEVHLGEIIHVDTWSKKILGLKYHFNQ